MENIDLATLLMAWIHTCRKCGEMRVMLCYHMLPQKMQEVFKDFGTEAEYLYCGNCHEYSSLSNWETL